VVPAVGGKRGRDASRSAFVNLKVLPTDAQRVPANGRVHAESPPEQLIPWVFERFAGQRIVITTQFGMEGCALIDMVAKAGQALKVIYLDTMFFFPETYALRDQLIERYPQLSFENWGTNLTPEEQERRYGPHLWKSDPDLCCKLRKVDPMVAVMDQADVWLTALRRSQSASRANLQTVEWNWKYQVLKVSPIASWSRKQVWEYIQEHDVPYNPLHEQGYPTVGCTHCTKSVAGASPDEYTRAGRWADKEKTECGLHGEGI
jgi:phosphoadenosine phosphosulfate reductase